MKNKMRVNGFYEGGRRAQAFTSFIKVIMHLCRSYKHISIDLKDHRQERNLIISGKKKVYAKHKLQNRMV